MRRHSLALLAAPLIAAASLTGAAAAAPLAGPDDPGPTPTPAAAVAPADGRTLLAKVVEALGGRARIAAVRDVHSRGEVIAKAKGGDLQMEMETTMVFPDRLAQQVDGPFGRFAMVATPAGAWLSGSEGAKDLPPAMRDEFLHQIQRTAFFLAQKADDPKFSVRLGGEEELGAARARILDLSYGDVSVRWFVDPASSRILRAAHDSKDQDGKPIHVVSDFTDFRDVEGFSLPFKLEVVTDGSPDQTVVLEEIKINAGADPKLFEKPPESTPAPKPEPTKKAR